MSEFRLKLSYFFNVWTRWSLNKLESINKQGIFVFLLKIMCWTPTPINKISRIIRLSKVRYSYEQVKTVCKQNTTCQYLQNVTALIMNGSYSWNIFIFVLRILPSIWLEKYSPQSQQPSKADFDLTLHFCHHQLHGSIHIVITKIQTDHRIHKQHKSKRIKIQKDEKTYS